MAGAKKKCGRKLPAYPIPAHALRLNMNKATEPEPKNSGTVAHGAPGSDLRSRAEARLEAAGATLPGNLDPAHLLRELQIRNAELEIQNDELRHEQALFQSLLETTPDHIYFKDRQSRFMRINGAMARRFGLRDPSHAVGKTDFDIFTDEHARQAFTDEQRIMSTGAALIGIEEKETWPDGRITWVSSTKTPLRDASGKIIGIVGISRDVTERKQMESALAEQAEAYRALFSTAFDGVIEVDEHLNIVDANRIYCRLLGYNRMELLGQRIHDIEGSETHEQVKHHMQRMQREGGGRFETKHRAKDGRLIDLELNVTFIPNRSRFIAFCRDITGRPKSEPKK
jgi:PAS domain S-box-containing protein